MLIIIICNLIAGNQISSDRYWYRGVSFKEMRIKSYVKRAEIVKRKIMTLFRFLFFKVSDTRRHANNLLSSHRERLRTRKPSPLHEKSL